MVPGCTKLESGGLFCLTIVKPVGIGEKEKGWFSWQKECQRLGLGLSAFSTRGATRIYECPLDQVDITEGGWGSLATGSQSLKRAFS